MKKLKQYDKGTFKVGALFDLDGVLVDTEQYYTDFWNDIDRRFPTGVENFALVIKGNTLHHILDTYFAPEHHAEIIDILHLYEKNMKYCAFEGIYGLLETLLAHGAGIAIVTSSYADKMAVLFKELPRLAELVHVVVTADYVTRSKPDPQGYLIASEAIGCDPSNCVVFEDSLSGLAAGRASGAMVVGIATTNPREKLIGHADVIIDRTTDFEPALLEQVLIRQN